MRGYSAILETAVPQLLRIAYRYAGVVENSLQLAIAVVPFSTGQ
jgi:hypothetical protein